MFPFVPSVIKFCLLFRLGRMLLGAAVAAAVLFCPVGPTLLSDGIAVAQEPQGVLIARPDELPPALGFLGKVELVFPIHSGSLCPDNAGCVFGPGLGVAVGAQRRWPSGFALGISYAVWFLDSAGVFEVGVGHQLRASVRYLFLPRRTVHPYIEAGIGAIVLGDSLQFGSVGVIASTAGGIELELTESLAITAAVPLHAVWLGPFTTTRDAVRRSEGFSPSLALSVQVGLVLLGP